MQLDRSAKVHGDLHSNGDVTLDRFSEVDGNVSLVGTLTNTAATVTGSVSQVSPEVLPEIPTEAEARAMADRIFEQDVELSAGAIDDIVFVDGTVQLSGGVSGSGMVIATGNIVIGPLDLWLIAPGSVYPIRLSLISFADVKVTAGDQPPAGRIVAGQDVIVQSARFYGVVTAHRNVHLESGSALIFKGFDETPPEVTEVVPADGSFVPTPQTEISASYADAGSGGGGGSPAELSGELSGADSELAAWDEALTGAATSGSGVDPQTVLLVVDGVDRTADAAITADRVVLPPGPILSDGTHTVDLFLTDFAGNETATSWSFIVDTVTPTVAFTEPTEALVLNDPAPRIVLAFADATSGIEPASVLLTMDGVEISDRCFVTATEAYCASPELPPGQHVANAEVRDRAGHPATASFAFETVQDVTGPEVTLTTPADGSLLGSATVQVTGTASDDGELVSVHVNGVQATLDGETFQATVTLPEGQSVVEAVAQDSSGKQGSAGAVVTVDTSPPTLHVDEPADGSFSNVTAATVSGEVEDSSPITSLTVAGEVVPLSSGRFEHQVTLAPGSNLLTVEAVDQVGHVGRAEVEVTYLVLPEVQITEPPDLATLTGTTVAVRGTVGDPTGTVDVNGVSAAVQADGSFLAGSVPLIEGGNVLTATLTTAGGAVNTASIHVVRDLTPPRVEITTPAEGEVVHTSRVAVSGMVNDLVAGTVNAQEATVTVNGVDAVVSNRSFLAEGVTLAPGENLLTALAVDESGNAGQASVRVVHQVPSDGPRIEIAGGDLQQGPVGTTLPEPLQVMVRAADGTPLAGRTVVFDEESGGGHLGSGKRRIASVTDGAGVATAQWTLGRRAGVQKVRATAVGVPGAVTFTASAGVGSAAFIVVDAGDQQVGTAGQQLPRPLIATITDAGYNRLGGVPVEWTVVKGAGHLIGGASSVIVPTDSDGRTTATLVLDSEDGISNNAVTARISGLVGSPVASFTASGRAAGPAAETAVTGVVLDNTSRPVAGVTVRIDDTTAMTTTDAAGQFRIDGAPVGEILLIVDGSTAQRPGVWASLEFRLTTIPGRDNDLGMPIFLLPLDVAGGLFVDETTGGVLELPEVPGLTLEVAPGTVTFPGGSKSGVVSMTVVHSDRVPMVPNFGQQPRLIVTIQPAGARFDPPARITYPNIEGLAPGETTDLYSFDHSLGHFVSIGPGTVSDDGSLIVSDPGVGIVKAGWHCGGDPITATGSPFECENYPCETCDGTQCVPIEASLPCDDKDDCTVNDQCSGGQCAGAAVYLRGVDALANGMKTLEEKAGEDIQFDPGTTLSTNCEDPLEFLWDFGDGTTSASRQPVHAFQTEGSYTVQLEVTCPHCSKVTKTSTANIKIVCPVPTNFRETSRSADSSGILHFRYEWDSSSGDLADLDMCQFLEQVVYPGPQDPYPWPPPWNYSQPNPSVEGGQADPGFAVDDHSPGNFRLPYRAASLTIQQRYIYTCSCLQDPMKPNALTNIFDIVRQIVQKPSGDWKYIITKQGLTGTIDPLPSIP